MLTFAGEPLLFPDVQVMAWMERNQDLADLCIFGQQQSRFSSSRHAVRSRFEQNKGIGLPVWNWPTAPAPRLNTVYWPTGATRWAYGLFLATRQTRDRIISRVHSSNGNVAATLSMGDDLDGGGLSPYSMDMWMLNPRPVSSTASDEDLWIIPLVDERYFWQFKAVADLEVTTSTTWATLFSTIATALGVTVTVSSSVEAAYLKPDPVEFTRRYENAAMLLDAAAASTGRRIVRRITGVVVAESGSIATATLLANLKRPYRLMAGGDYGALGGECPATVAVTYRKIKQHLLRSNGQVLRQTKAATGAPVKASDATLTIHCAAYADYNTSDTLQNGTALQTLTDKIAADYYAWQATRYDYTFGEIQPWDLCGFDDHVLWTFGRPIPGESQVHVSGESLADGSASFPVRPSVDLLAQTRVQSLPVNVWPELNACSDPDKQVFEPRLYAKANADIAGGAEGTVSLYTGYATDTGKDVVVRNISSVQWDEDAGGWAEGIGDAEWLGTPAECSQL